MELEKIDGGVTAPKGFLAGGMACGIKKDLPDLGLLSSTKEARAAGVFTTNLVKAAPVLVSSQQIIRGKARAIIANSGNANACTGEEGLKDAWTMVESTAKALEVPPEEVLVCSTGVIGEPLPIEAIQKGIESLAANISPQGGETFARAIMTTDSFPKSTALEVTTSQGTFRMGGAAKGAGMIHPSMATMLAFITTDLEIEAPALREALKKAVDLSFNRISVDGDTSTNDTVLILANGSSGVKGQGEALQALKEGLKKICQELAHMIVRDGEGATKVVKILVKGAPSDREAEMAARRMANSLLVKTALHGEDPNWGRLAAALGSSGCRVEPERLQIWIGEVQIVKGGMGLPQAEDPAHQVMRKREYTITLDLGLGPGEYWMWTCDLTYEYVRINAEYRS
ncbi:MAG TPA: bifunctional glutamate N-acetyltransferase/amino-acid acetyltransferase ArgJ [Thermosulfidibacter takaii]|uniref:Arginine biosynthesis bifunctional protein ArgJ n=1 Tax=Thermosulfidibacter takaii TaxID=412593 RepID=A0A7C0U609_9BACT|nr:bifunctional glutamate N-acetyltransferase/amino-acid acetyltransferase ArgJ [Thermosulfidibacter takaii]